MVSDVTDAPTPEQLAARRMAEQRRRIRRAQAALASLEAHLTSPLEAHHAVLLENAVDRIDHYIDAAAINLGLHRTGG